ncbi:Predicted dehydrogenase [Geodermatophilus africanus]|uniref:Predicted dehydrogenase n=1 Tax=Geodermatophilus africanus TaxID=1137993 RepID=A0A1H3B6E5_9ACTN|nr:Gfo/Idh/MocA family oxidoreductase [Geodermatophilus africanus]SDX36629.1 Predicted dehydrogenase [Geodermatophilus africanus]
MTATPAGVRIAVVGAGLIGRRHAGEVAACPATRLVAVVDPGPAGDAVADRYGVPRYRSLAELLERDRPDGVVLATPNRLHVDGGLACVAAGVPTLVEKPVGDTVAAATRLVEAAEAAGVPLLVGHHRRHSPLLARAREIVAGGVLGRLVAVVGTALFAKPDDYFDVGGGWRRQPGGGPVLINLVHEVDGLRWLVGDVVRVQATTSDAVRGLPVEDTAAVVLTFANGALGTFLLSDAAASPRSWEQTSGEDTSYPSHPDEDCYHLAGTAGSLSIPTMRLRTSTGPPSWREPFETATVEVPRRDPLAAQVEHFAAVVRGEAEPLCSGRDGLATLRVLAAVVESAATGRPVDLPGAAANRPTLGVRPPP